MASGLVGVGHDVKEKRLDVEIQRLVIEEEFGQEAEILTIHFVLFAVHFEHGDFAFAVNLVARGMAPNALG